MGTHTRLAGLLMVAILTLTGGAPVASEGRLTAELDGRRIPLKTVSDFHCHDLAYPKITCFRSLAEAEADIRHSLAARGTLSLNYVRMYEDDQYQGASLAVSQGYPNLGTIGWNDRVSSFKVLNGGSGSFREHAGPEGASYPFCCANSVPDLGSWNDVFSAVSGSA